MKESIKRQVGRHYQQKRSNEERKLGIDDKSKVLLPIHFNKEKEQINMTTRSIHKIAVHWKMNGHTIDHPVKWDEPGSGKYIFFLSNANPEINICMCRVTGGKRVSFYRGRVPLKKKKDGKGKKQVGSNKRKMQWSIRKIHNYTHYFAW